MPNKLTQLTKTASKLLLLIVTAFVVSGAALLQLELNSYSVTPKPIENSETNQLVIHGNRFRPIGAISGGISGTSAVISNLKNGEGFIESSTSISTEQYPFFTIDLQGANPDLKVVLFWTTLHQPNEPAYLNLNIDSSGTYWADLSKESRWSGRISSIAIGVFGDLHGEPLTINQVSFHPATLASLAHITVQDWTQFHGWTQASINRVGFSGSAAITAALFTGITWLTCLIILALGSMVARQHIGKMAGVATFGVLWLVFDLNWQRHLIIQHAQARETFADKTMSEKKLADIDGDLFREIQALRPLVSLSPQSRIWILIAQRDSFTAYRAKYHLTPLQSYYYHDAPFMHYLMKRLGPATTGDYLLVVDEVSNLLFDADQGRVQLYDLCWSANKDYQGATFTLLHLQSDAVDCPLPH